MIVGTAGIPEKFLKRCFILRGMELYREQDPRKVLRKNFSTLSVEDVEDAPRHVSLSLLGKVYAAGVVAYLVVLFGVAQTMLWDSGPVTSSSLILFAILIVAGISFALGLVRGLLHRKLLRDGSCSTGTVVRRWRAGRKSVSIAYEFPVGGYKPMTGKGSAQAGDYNEGDPVVVFYNPEDISKYVAICGTVWRVRTKTGTVLEP
jgi:hypothetical protein